MVNMIPFHTNPLEKQIMVAEFCCEFATRMNGVRSLQGRVDTAIRRALTNPEKTTDFDQSGVLTFLARWGSMVPNVGHRGEIVGSARRLKDETTADLSDIEKEELDRKTDRHDLTNDTTDGVYVLTQSVVVKTDHERSLTVEVEVERMESELSEDERNILAHKESASRPKATRI